MKLKNWIVLSLTVTLLGALSGAFISCEWVSVAPPPPGYNDFYSRSSDSRDRDEDDRDRRSSRDRDRVCDDRDSCADSCDNMFTASRSRSECYDLDFEDVNTLEEVFDDLVYGVSNKSNLEDLDDDDLQFFLEIDPAAWSDIINGNRQDGKNGLSSGYSPYSSKKAQNVLEWLAEDEDAAQAVWEVEEDRDSNMMENLFRQLEGKYGNSQGRIVAAFRETPSRATWVAIEGDDRRPGQEISYAKENVQPPRSYTGSLKVDGTQGFHHFVMNFIGLKPERGKFQYFDNSSFIDLAEDNDNNAAIELAHNSLVQVCKEATRQNDENDEKVRQCFATVYCVMQAVTDYGSNSVRFGGNEISNPQILGDSVFEALEDAIGGGLPDEGDCKYEHLIDKPEKL